MEDTCAYPLLQYSWQLLNLQLGSQLGDVSRLLFSCQGLVSHLQLCSVAGPAWGPRRRIFSSLDYTQLI